MKEDSPFLFFISLTFLTSSIHALISKMWPDYCIASVKMTEGNVIECRAAIAWEPNKPLSIEKVEVSPPQKCEVRIKIHYTAICHTDIFGWEGSDPTLRFPLILGHEGAGIIESVGSGVESFRPGDTVIPSPIAHCQKCKNCQNPKANICDKFLFGSDRGQIMDDGKSRFKCKGKEIYHFIGLSTFSEFIVVREECVCKINPKAPLDKVCLIGCGVTTGYGAPFNSSIVTPGSNVGVWGLGAIGLAVILGCRDRGAKNIVAIDTNGERLKNAKKFGATQFLNPKEPLPEGKTLVEYFSKKFDGGLDFTFEASGNTEAMSQAIECTKRGTGQTTILGVSAKNVQISAATLLLGRTVRGCVVGGYKAKEAMPMLVEKYLHGKLMLEKFINWRFSLEEINKGIEHLFKSEGIRSVIKMAE